MPTSTLSFTERSCSELEVFEWVCVSGDILSTRAVLIGLADMVDRTVALFNIKPLHS